jgi:hypothetical protein
LQICSFAEAIADAERFERFVAHAADKLSAYAMSRVGRGFVERDGDAARLQPDSKR